MTNKILLTTVMVVLTQFLFAQDLHIYYDTQSEILKYEVDGQNVEKPIVKRGQNIYLHVQNFNNYLYKPEVKVNESAAITSVKGSVGGNPFSSLMSMDGGGMPSFSLLSSMGMQDVGGIEVSDQDDGEYILGFAKEESNSALQSLQLEYNQSLQKVKAAESALIDMSKEIKQEIEARKIYGMVAKEIDYLKYSPDLEPRQIKTLANEYLSKVFNVDHVSEIDLDYVLDRSDIQGILNDQQIELVKKKQNYKKEISGLEGIAYRITSFDVDGENLSLIDRSISEVHTNSKNVLLAADQDLETLDVLIDSSESQDVSYLAHLRYEYESIMANEFAQTFRAPANGDEITFNVRFVSRNTEYNIPEQVQKAPIDVVVSGGIEVNASIGLSFGSFSKPLEEYFVRNDVITAEKKDDILPMLTSYIHFYKRTNNSVTFGGSIGIGFPIVGGGSISSISFMVGPSVIIGKSNRIILSGGVMTGQAERLSQGYSVGDSYVSEVDVVPTKNQYEFGYFVGLSYNLGR